MKRLCSLLLSALAIAVLQRPACAVPVYYFNDPIASRLAFETAAPAGLEQESFEDNFSPAASRDFPVGGPVDFTVSTNNGSLSQDNFARGVSDGSFSLAAEEEPQTTLTFQFTSSVNAFGLDVNDLNFVDMTFEDDLGNSFANVLLGDDGSADGGPGFENRQFFGVINSTPFSSVVLRFSRAALSGTIFLDNLKYGAVPEPTALVLLGTGIVGVMGRRSRRRTQKRGTGGKNRP